MALSVHTPGQFYLYPSERVDLMPVQEVLVEVGEEDEKQDSQGCARAKRGESTIILSASWLSQGLLRHAEPVSLYPYLTSFNPTVLDSWRSCRKCLLKCAEG